MKNTGQDIVNAIVQRLVDTNVRAYDHNVVNLLKTLNFQEVNQLFSFGDVQRWHNERIVK